MSKAWTPGPWHVQREPTFGERDNPDAEKYFRGVFDANGNKLVLAGVAITMGHHEESEANSVLCSAAPELYDACLAVRQHLQLFCGPDDAIANFIIGMADKALAKARGEQP